MQMSCVCIVCCSYSTVFSDSWIKCVSISHASLAAAVAAALKHWFIASDMAAAPSSKTSKQCSHRSHRSPACWNPCFPQCHAMPHSSQTHFGAIRFGSFFVPLVTGNARIHLFCTRRCLTCRSFRFSRDGHLSSPRYRYSRNPFVLYMVEVAACVVPFVLAETVIVFVWFRALQDSIRL